MAAKFRTYYFDEAVSNLPGVIDKCRKALAGVEFDTIVGTGFSGGIVIPSLAMAMGKKFVLIRKDGDDSHHGGGRLVGELGERWIFVDDFVYSGRTRERVIRKIANAVVGTDLGSTMVGQYMYAARGYEVTGFQSSDPAWIPGDMARKTSACPCSLCRSKENAR